MLEYIERTVNVYMFDDFGIRLVSNSGLIIV